MNTKTALFALCTVATLYLLVIAVGLLEPTSPLPAYITWPIGIAFAAFAGYNAGRFLYAVMKQDD